MTQKPLSTILFLGMLVACTNTNIQMPTQGALPETLNSKLPTLMAETLPISDGGLISDQPCASPCFFGVLIGETQLSDIVPVLENNGISPCYNFNETTIVCGDGVFTIIVGTDPATSIVDGITYYPSLPVSIGNVIKKYGEPNLTWVESEGTPEEPYTSMFLLWDSMKMRIDLPKDKYNIEEQAYSIESETKIWSVTFMNNTDFSDLVTNSYDKPWNGYGNYLP